MKIKNRLTLVSSVVFGIVFTIASALVYFFFQEATEKVIIRKLEQSSRLTAMFYLEEDELTRSEHRQVEEQFFKEVLEIEVQVYDDRNQVSFGEAAPDQAITAQVLNTIRHRKKYHFRKGTTYYYGLFYPDNQGDFVVLLSENNALYATQLQRLLLILLVVLALGLLAIYFLSRALANLAYRPIKEVIEQVRTIGPDSLDKPIATPGTNDEVQELIETYNVLLKRLSESFVIQKNFINYVSHEFKTPLASIAGKLEVFGLKDRQPAEYERVTKEALRDVYHIEEILNTLMTVSGLRAQAGVSQQVRIDEVLWDLIEQQPPEHQSQVKLQLAVLPEKEHLLNVQSNSAQLAMGIGNLLENALKYSHNQPVQVWLGEHENRLQLRITDSGAGIPEEELRFIYQPFYRGSNVQHTKGSGIGLSLSAIIFKQNNIQFSVASEVGKGTVATLLFPAQA